MTRAAVEETATSASKGKKGWSPAKIGCVGCAILAVILVGLLAVLGTLTDGTQGPIPFDVIEREESGTDKVSFDIRVDLLDGRLPTVKELRAVSVSLKAEETAGHDRAFVVFYLPGMVVDSGGFATAHHNRNLEVKILTFNLLDKYTNLETSVGTPASE